MDDGNGDSSVERLAKDIKEDSKLRVVSENIECVKSWSNKKKTSFFSKDELITKYGYNGETHNVETEDGYILTVHRIRKDNGKPIFLQHGLIDSSAGYVIMGPNSSLGKFHDKKKHFENFFVSIQRGRERQKTVVHSGSN